MNEENPGWLYEVNMGATTIWERWNSVNPDGKISGIGMNSMNHYAYGAVFEWVYKNVCGLNPVPDVPGYKKAVIRPQPDVRLGAAKAKVNTAAGYYETGWQYEDNGEVTYTVVIPFDRRSGSLPAEKRRHYGRNDAHRGYVYVYTVKVFKNKQRAPGKKNEKSFCRRFITEKNHRGKTR